MSVQGQLRAATSYQRTVWNSNICPATITAGSVVLLKSLSSCMLSMWPEHCYCLLVMILLLTAPACNCYTVFGVLMLFCMNSIFSIAILNLPCFFTLFGLSLVWLEGAIKLNKITIMNHGMFHFITPHRRLHVNCWCNVTSVW